MSFKKIFSLLSLVLAGAIVIAIIFMIYHLQQDQITLKHHLNQALKEQKNIQYINDENLKKNQKKENDRVLNVFHLAMKRLEDKTSEDQLNNQWYLQKAQFALETAQLEAISGEDPQHILALLNLADQFLSHYTLADGAHIRQQLSADRLPFEEQPSIDKIGLLNQLSNLEKQINQKTASLRHPHFSSETKQNHLETTEPQADTSWQYKIKQYLNKIKPFFILRKQPPHLDPLLTPAYQAIQRETLAFYLEEMRWSIIHTDQTLFNYALTQCIDTLNALFKPQQIQPILHSLEHLKSVEFTKVSIIPSKALTAIELAKEKQP